MANEVTITVRGKDQGGKSALAGLRQELIGTQARGQLAADTIRTIGEHAQRFLGQAAKASADLGESMNAVNVVFKGSAQGIAEIGESAASSMGLSQRAFNDAAVRFSNFAKTVAGPGGDVVKIIQDITQRSSDFASVMNLDVNQAMEVFQSGLAGESEPLRKYGIDVSAAAVQTFAYANGLAEAGAQLNEAQKVQARYGLIMQQTADMQGDFANTADSAANAQRILAAEWENAQASLGQVLLPVISHGAAALSNLASILQGLPEPLRLVVGVVGLLAAGLLILVPRIVAARDAMIGFGLSAQAANRALGVIGLVLTVGAAALAAFNSSSDDATTGISQFKDTLDEATGAVTDNTRALAIQRLEETGAAEAAAKLRVNMADLTDAALGDEEARMRAVAAWNAYGDSLSDSERRSTGYLDTLQVLLEGLELTKEELATGQEQWERSTEAIEGSTAAVDEATAAAQEAAAAWKEAAAELETYTEMIKAQTDPVFAWTRATQNAKEKQDALNEAIAKYGEESPQAQQAALDLADAQLEVFDASGKLTGSSDQLIDALQQMRDDGYLSEAAFRALRDAIRQADRAAEAADGSRSRFYEDHYVNVTYSYTGVPSDASLRPGSKYASGGVVGAATPAQGGGPRGNRVLVGERRAEVVELPVGSRVIPSVDQATDRNQLGWGGGTVEVRLVVDSVGSDRIADAVKWIIENGVRTDGAFRATVAEAVGS